VAPASALRGGSPPPADGGPAPLLKDVRRDVLVSSVQVVAAGDALLAPSVTRRLIREFAPASRAERIAGFLPIPGLAASVLAVILGTLSGSKDADGRRHRSGAAVTGMMLGCVSIALFLVICIIYFGVLGYPLPQIHRYQPPVPSSTGACHHAMLLR
jgi:hypothetical protein